MIETRSEIQREEARIRRLADEAHAKYPQYAGYFDGWHLLEVVSVKGLRPRGRRAWEPLPYETIGQVDGDDIAVYHIGMERVCLLGRENVHFIKPLETEIAAEASARGAARSERALQRARGR